MSLEVSTQRAADTLAASSAGLAGFAWIADAEPYITALAGVVAIVAGVAATWYHIERASAAHRRNRKERDEDRANK